MERLRVYVKLSQDNNWENKHNKRGIEISESIFEKELKAFFGWRTPTKKHKSLKERFGKLGSHKYDKFINHLINKYE